MFLSLNNDLALQLDFQLFLLNLFHFLTLFHLFFTVVVGSSNFNSKFDKTCCFVPSFMSFFLLFFRKIQWSFFFLTIWSFLLFSSVLSWATLGKALKGHIKKQVCTECLFVCFKGRIELPLSDESDPYFQGSPGY